MGLIRLPIGLQAAGNGCVNGHCKNVNSRLAFSKYFGHVIRMVRGWFVDHQLVDRPTGRLCQLVDRANMCQLVDTISLTVNWSTGISFLSTGRLYKWSTSYEILYNLSTGRQILIYYIRGQLVDTNWSTGLALSCLKLALPVRSHLWWLLTG